MKPLTFDFIDRCVTSSPQRYNDSIDSVKPVVNRKKVYIPVWYCLLIASVTGMVFVNREAPFNFSYHSKQTES